MIFILHSNADMEYFKQWSCKGQPKLSALQAYSTVTVTHWLIYLGAN